MKIQAKWLSQTNVLLLFLVVLGIVLRFPGYDGRALWVDELWRANLILEKGALSIYWNAPNLYTAITAPFYLVLNKLIVLIDSSSWSLRLSSFIPGLVSIVVAFFIAKRAGAGLFWATSASILFATNTDFIRYSNEFKPYMLEVMVHLVCMYLWLDLLMSKPSRHRQWLVFSAALIIAAFCAANIVFVLPAMALSLAEKVLTEDRTKLKALVICFFTTGITVVALYFLVWSYGSDKGLISYWADSFYNAGREEYVIFASKNLFQMMEGAFSVLGASVEFFIVSVIGLLASIFFCIKLGLFRIQPVRGLLIYFLVLIFTVLLLNRIGMWPIGKIRPNLFLFAIFASWWVILLSNVFKGRLQWLLAALTIVVMAMGIIKTSRTYLVNLSPPVEQNDRVWAAFSTSATVGKSIVEKCNEKPIIIFITSSMSHAYRFYANFGGNGKNGNALTSDCVALKFVPEAYIDEDGFRRLIAAEQPSSNLQWYLYSHINEQEFGKLVEVAQEFGVINSGESFEGAGYFSVMSAQPMK